eukprot:1159480-Pelagomonas_calceolata.AAC.1
MVVDGSPAWHVYRSVPVELEEEVQQPEVAAVASPAKHVQVQPTLHPKLKQQEQQQKVALLSEQPPLSLDEVSCSVESYAFGELNVERCALGLRVAGRLLGTHSLMHFVALLGILMEEVDVVILCHCMPVLENPEPFYIMANKTSCYESDMSALYWSTVLQFDQLLQQELSNAREVRQQQSRDLESPQRLQLLGGGASGDLEEALKEEGALRAQQDGDVDVVLDWKGDPMVVKPGDRMPKWL